MGSIVGAYPLYTGLDDPSPVIEALAASDLVRGLEVPVTGGKVTLPPGGHPDWVYVVSLIPETMARMALDPVFGLASPDLDGRAAAVRVVRDVHAQIVHADVPVLAVELHSAPTRIADPGAFEESLATITGWDWGATDVVVEHCDAWTTAHPVQKGFLSQAAELDVAGATGAGVTVNWARSVIESRDLETGLDHIEAARDSGLLRGVMFSSVSNADTAFGPAWSDMHLVPTGTSDTTPGSLLDPATIWACLEAAPDAWYGFKINATPDTPVDVRIAHLLETAALVRRD